MADRGRVIVHVEHGKPFEIREYELPDPEPGAIIVKIEQAGICGSDLHTWRGDQVNIPIPPGGRVMGHEGRASSTRWAPESPPTAAELPSRKATG